MVDIKLLDQGLQIYLRPRVPLIFDLLTPKSLPFHPLAPWTTCVNLHQNRFIRFQHFRVDKLVTDERTNQPTDKLRTLCLLHANLAWQRYKMFWRLARQATFISNSAILKLLSFSALLTVTGTCYRRPCEAYAWSLYAVRRPQWCSQGQNLKAKAKASRPRPRSVSARAKGTPCWLPFPFMVTGRCTLHRL